MAFTEGGNFTAPEKRLAMVDPPPPPPMVDAGLRNSMLTGGIVYNPSRTTCSFFPFL